MLSRQHKLRLKEEGIVGHVISNGAQRVIADVNEDQVHFKNPSLPLTRSEMAVPLRFGSEIIGAIDVQSQNVGQFNQEDVQLLQEMADGLAPLVDKLRQIEAINRELEELKGREQEATVRRWQAGLRSSRRNLHYRFSDSEADPVTDGGSASQTFSPVSSMEINPLPADGSESARGSGSMITVPIKFRDQTLGVVNLKVGDQKVSEEFVALIDSATDRLALALENARLLEDIQQRADREHRVANISDRVRAATDIDEILKTAAEEIGKSLGVGEVRIQLKTTSTR
jgi:GAF domain-containing protein